jgi:hypothetical protein
VALLSRARARNVSITYGIALLGGRIPGRMVQDFQERVGGFEKSS